MIAPFLDKRLNDTFQTLDTRYNLKDETARFKSWVNFSSAFSEPFHRWARYREGFSGSLVQELLDRSPQSKDSTVVADPMCGSGSTLVAARQRGFDVIGCDVNDFAAFISES